MAATDEGDVAKGDPTELVLRNGRGATNVTRSGVMVLLLTLDPGNYVAEAQGALATPGAALVDLYEVPE